MLQSITSRDARGASTKDLYAKVNAAITQMNSLYTAGLDTASKKAKYKIGLPELRDVANAAIEYANDNLGTDLTTITKQEAYHLALQGFRTKFNLLIDELNASESSSSSSSSSEDYTSESSSSSESTASSQSESSSSESTASSQSESSSSSSLEGFELTYTGVGFSTADLNGEYVKTDVIEYGSPTYYNDNGEGYYLWITADGYWVISNDVDDPANQFKSSSDVPQTYPTGTFVDEDGTIEAGATESSSSESDGNTSSSTSSQSQ